MTKVKRVGEGTEKEPYKSTPDTKADRLGTGRR